MECEICGLAEDETNLFDGISSSGIVKICEKCAEEEGIPLLRKPSQDQLDIADRRYSVRERMEIMSGLRKTRPISKEQTVANKNLAKLRLPPQKQTSEKLVDNYDWEIKLARRRQKLTTKQLALLAEIPLGTLEALEKGQLPEPEQLEPTIKKLEQTLEIKIFKEHPKQINFKINKDKAREILKQVRQKIEQEETSQEDEEEIIESVEEQIEYAKQTKEQKLSQLQKGKLDFSKHENIQGITLNDLINLKKEREEREQFKKEKQEHEEMFGKDVELDEVGGEED